MPEDDGDWRDRLDILTRDLHGEAELTPLGMVIAYGQLVAALANRARMHELWQRHPEILDQQIRAPVIVLGQMRSGTTRMQRLLACDPRLAHTRFFESWNPVPAGKRLRALDDRRLRGWLALRAARWLNPQFDVIHPTRTAEPDEEIGFHNIAVFGSAYEAQWRVPGFAAACETMDTRPVYGEFRRLLQTIAWLRGESGGRPWILKLPQMTQDLASVLAIFPDARLVCLDRPAPALVASSASLVLNQMQVQSNAVDPHWIGREWLRKVALRRRRTDDARAGFGGPQIDVSFDEIGADWRAAMRKVYRILDLPLLPEVEQRMARYLARKRHRRLADHHYSLGQFGLTQAEVEAAIAPTRFVR
ncbi:sulfotransferase [Sphingosinicella sp. YJ22]|uniref:sulfotransferase family protein n=1 Tax=Sphingosinicella sp. YJ22 TaxID=1104780 RepID=UPI00140A7E03|nr:sulfotransferase [Sphingosinicella sp. YJ22]